MHRLAPSTETPQVLRIELHGDQCTAASCSKQPQGMWWGEWEFNVSYKFSKVRCVQQEEYMDLIKFGGRNFKTLQRARKNNRHFPKYDDQNTKVMSIPNNK